MYLLKRLFPIIAIMLAACASIAAKPEYPVATLYDHHWINTTSPDAQQDIASIARELTQYDVVIFGEFHSHPGIHLAQMRLMQALHQLRPKLSLSMEQFERDTQAILDAYLSAEIGERQMRDKARAWDNYPGSYRPMVEYAREHGLPVIAANAPKNVVICVGRKGLDVLDAMPERDRQYIAKTIDISAGAYKAQYMDFLSKNTSHGGGAHGEPSAAMQAMAERSFAAQAVRDETMAESIAQHLKTNPKRQLLHLTGHFHSDSFLGTVERLANRMPDLNIAVINPVSLSKKKLSWDKDDLETGTILLLVGQLPKDFEQKDNAMQWSREILKQRMGNECKLLIE